MRARLVSLFIMVSFGMQPVSSLYVGYTAAVFWARPDCNSGEWHSVVYRRGAYSDSAVLLLVWSVGHHPIAVSTSAAGE